MTHVYRDDTTRNWIEIFLTLKLRFACLLLRKTEDFPSQFRIRFEKIPTVKSFHTHCHHTNNPKLKD